MAKVLITESYLTDIANAIRSKNGSTTQYKPSEMASAILAITTSGGGSGSGGSGSGSSGDVTYTDTGVDCSAMTKLGEFSATSTTAGDLSGYTIGRLLKCLPNHKQIHFKAVIFVPTGLSLNDAMVSDFTNGRAWSANNDVGLRKSYSISTGTNYVFDWDETLNVTTYLYDDDKTNDLLTYYCCTEITVKQNAGSTTALDTATLTVSAYKA